MILNIENHSHMDGDYYFDDWAPLHDFINENWEDTADYWIASSPNTAYMEIRDIYIENCSLPCTKT